MKVLITMIVLVSFVSPVVGQITGKQIRPQTPADIEAIAIINKAIIDSRSGGERAASRSEVDLTNLLREASGAVAAFGSRADEIFLKIDRAKAAADDNRDRLG